MAKASVTPRVRDGKTTYLVRWRDESGKQCKRSFGRKTDANRFRTEVEHSLNTGTYVDQRAGQVSVKEYAETWRNAQPHRPNTARRVLSSLTVHVYPKIGHRPLAAVRMSELQAIVGTTALALKPASTRVVFSTVTAVFAAAVRDRLIPNNPAEGVKLPEVHPVRITPLTVEQVNRLVEALPRRFQAIALVAAMAGLRCGEVCGLRVCDVDFLRRTIRVQQQSQPHGIGPLKNRSAYRDVPFGAGLLAVLSAHLAEFPAKGEEFVFRTAGGRVMSDALLKEAWARARLAAGLPGVGMHDLRHMYASVLIAKRRSVKEVSERLGHANAAMTLNVYSHLWPSDEEGTRAAVDEFWRDDDKREGMAG